MNDDDKRHHPDEDIETGESIAELASLRETPAAGFLDQIRHSIQRRMFAAQAVDFSLNVFLRTMFDYLSAALDALRGPQPPQQGE